MNWEMSQGFGTFGTIISKGIQIAWETCTEPETSLHLPHPASVVVMSLSRSISDRIHLTAAQKGHCACLGNAAPCLLNIIKYTALTHAIKPKRNRTGDVRGLVEATHPGLDI